MPSNPVLHDKSSNLLWLPPTPLSINETLSSPYPTESLPRLIKNAVVDYFRYGQQPLPLIACSALANVSLACQTLANVGRDRLLKSPTSLYFFVVASSGERKTASDNTFGEAIRQWELKIREKLEPKVEISRTLHRAWVAEKEGVLAQIRKSALAGEDTAYLKRYLLEISASEPIIPMLPILFFEDTTQEALVSHMANGWPSASIWSDEGGIVLGGHGMQNNTTKFVALLNRLWDGKPFTAHRKTTKSATISNRRLTVSIMLQPLILEQMLSKNDGINRQSGFMARCLIAYPTSAMGERYYQEPPESLSSLHQFHSRLTECLNESLSLDHNGCHKIPCLYFDNKAKSHWIKFFNEIEEGLSKQWSTIKDFASKAGENTARLAALFHLFEGKESQINIEDVERAIEIISWHLSETKRIFNASHNSDLHNDAIRLLNWIREKKIITTTPRYIQQYSPIRDKRLRNNALDLLNEHGYLQETNLNGKTSILINPKIIN